MYVQCVIKYGFDTDKTQRCRALNNFSTLTSIISALGTAPIHRLSRTWNQVNARTMTILEQMRKLMGSTKNFGEYREKLHLANPPCIPFFGRFYLYFPGNCIKLTFYRCISHGLDVYRGRHSICDQAHQSHKLC